MIYKYYAELYLLMPYAVSYTCRYSGFVEEEFSKDFAIYKAGGHLSPVTWINYISIHSPFATMLHTKFGFDWPSDFTEDC